MSAYNDRVIAEFRANGGRVQHYGTGLVLLHTTGARSGEARINPVLALPDGDAWLVIASAAGASANPAWYFNLLAHPDLTIETPDGTADVHAVDLVDDADWQSAFDRFVARSSTFADYAARAAPRRMPILRLDPRG